jgi:hypothetical protein
VIHSEMSRVSKAQQSPTLLTTNKSGIKNKTVDVETTSVEHGKGDAEIPEETPTTPHRPKTPLSLLKYIVTFAVKLFTAQEKNHLSQHVQTTMHLTSLNPESTDNFCNDLCEAFVAANIPLSKLQNPVLKRFLQKYTNRFVPDESTLRKNYVPNCYNKVMKSIENRVSNNYLWVSADETTNILGRCVTNIIIGTLHPTLPYTPYLIATKMSTRINAEMSKFINESLNSVLKSDRNCQNTILFISDAAAYMIKTGK